jgi:outer membrane biogenesis lipoprotein LolB
VRTLLLALVLALLAGCASQGGRLVSAGHTQRVFDVQFDTTLDWARVRGPR